MTSCFYFIFSAILSQANLASTFVFSLFFCTENLVRNKRTIKEGQLRLLVVKCVYRYFHESIFILFFEHFFLFLFIMFSHKKQKNMSVPIETNDNHQKKARASYIKHCSQKPKPTNFKSQDFTFWFQHCFQTNPKQLQSKG